MVTFAQKQSYFLYGGESEGVSEGVNEGVSEGVNEGVSEGVNMLFNLIENIPGKRIPFFKEQMRIPAKTIERWLARLKSERKIEFRGAPKTGGYYAVEGIKP